MSINAMTAKKRCFEIIERFPIEQLNNIADSLEAMYKMITDIKQRVPIELNDGHGSYICEHGHIHNYSDFDFDAAEHEAAALSTKIYNTVDEMWEDLDTENTSTTL